MILTSKLFDKKKNNIYLTKKLIFKTNFCLVFSSGNEILYLILKTDFDNLFFLISTFLKSKARVRGIFCKFLNTTGGLPEVKWEYEKLRNGPYSLRTVWP